MTKKPSSSPYDAEHQAIRRNLLPWAYNTLCPLCDKLMLRGQDLDLDHTRPVVSDRSSKGDRIVHAKCNQSSGGRLGAMRRNLKPSRVW